MNTKSENKICQNCKKDFVVEPDDFSFYEKIKVPPPTWCPKCRMMRRTTFRNIRSLYKRICGLCGKNTITMYHEDDPAPVYCHSCWHGDEWDPYAYGQDIDWSKSFFTQWQELFKKVPRFDLWQVPPLQNCEYTNYSINNKNCYLAYSVTGCEDTRYSENIDKSKNCLDNLYLSEGENCYENIDCVKNYNCRYVMQSRECLDSWFLFDCSNCQNCFMSANLRNGKYVFRGEQLSKEEYEKRIKELKTETYNVIEELKKEFKELFSLRAIHKYADIVASRNSTGNHILNSKNIKNSYGVAGSEDIKNGMRVLANCKDSQDFYGLAGGELIYDSVAVSYNTYNCAFSFLCNTSMRNSQYTTFCLNSSNLFGCVGIKKGEFSILNKRYEEKEYYALVQKLIEHMNTMPYVDSKRRVYAYGEFFPPEFSPYCYNETIAFDLYPISKEEAEKYGFSWLKTRSRSYNITMTPADMTESSKDASKEICSETIGCMHSGSCDHQCTNAFRILPEDFDFYNRFNLPLPRLCPNCRHYERLAYREPVELWHRSCMCDKANHFHGAENCEVEFETSYASDRPEIVYCEKCYQQEVY